MFNFDRAQQFGPCNGLTRMERWERAERFKLSPPTIVKLCIEHYDLGIPIDRNLTAQETVKQNVSRPNAAPARSRKLIRLPSSFGKLQPISEKTKFVRDNKIFIRKWFDIN